MCPAPPGLERAELLEKRGGDLVDEPLLLLVSDLLSTAQIESGSLRMSPEPTDLAEVVRTTIERSVPD